MAQGIQPSTDQKVGVSNPSGRTLLSFLTCGNKEPPSFLDGGSLVLWFPCGSRWVRSPVVLGSEGTTAAGSLPAAPSYQTSNWPVMLWTAPIDHCQPSH